MAKNIVHIDWEGGYSIDQVISTKSGKDDCGIYQIYGKHPIYGPNSLIYIGVAVKQSFSERFKDHMSGWLKDHDLGSITIYLGDVYRQHSRVYSESEDFLDDEWEKITKQCEQLLIYALGIGYNSKNIQSTNESELKELHILNWGNRGDLLPELSGDRWTEKYD